MSIDSLDAVLQIVELWSRAQSSPRTSPAATRSKSKRSNPAHDLLVQIQAVRADLEAIVDESVRNDIAAPMYRHLVSGLGIVIGSAQGVDTDALLTTLQSEAEHLLHELQETHEALPTVIRAVAAQRAAISRSAAEHASPALRSKLGGIGEAGISEMNRLAEDDIAANAKLFHTGKRILTRTVLDMHNKIKFKYRAAKWLVKSASLGAGAMIQGITGHLNHPELVLPLRAVEEAFHTFYTDPRLQTKMENAKLTFDRYIAAEGAMMIIQAGVITLGALLIKAAMQSQLLEQERGRLTIG